MGPIRALQIVYEKYKFVYNILAIILRLIKRIKQKSFISNFFNSNNNNRKKKQIIITI